MRVGKVWRKGTTLFATLVFGGGVLGACSSGGSSSTSTALKSACQEVGATLSDGPDPGVDPLGYADAQVFPLRQLHIAKSSLRGAVDSLALAYQRLYDTNGSTAAKQGVARATSRLNAICPGVAS